MERLTYTQVGDYLLPNIRLKEQPDIPIGKYGLMRKSYLMNHRKILYNSLILKEQLYPHLLEIDSTANRRLEQLMSELTTKDPGRMASRRVLKNEHGSSSFFSADQSPPDKADDQMAWVAHMNGSKAQAEEFIFTELIYD